MYGIIFTHARRRKEIRPRVSRFLSADLAAGMAPVQQARDMRSSIPRRSRPPLDTEVIYYVGSSVGTLSGQPEGRIHDRRIATALSKGTLKRPFNRQPSGSQRGRKSRKVPGSLSDHSDDSGDDSDGSDGSVYNDDWNFEDNSGYGYEGHQEEENIQSTTNLV